MEIVARLRWQSSLSGVSRLRGCGSAHPSLSRCISRNRHPSYNAKLENCIKTLKVEAVYLKDYETFADVAADLPLLATSNNTRRFRSALGHLSPAQFEDHRAWQTVKTVA
jgi:putative transposase